MMPANELAAVIVKALDAKKGENIQLLKTQELTTLADYFVICTASSSTHVKTLTDAVEAAADDVGEPVLRREGHRSGSWVLLDYGCVIVHVFQDEARKFYDLSGSGATRRSWTFPICAPERQNKTNRGGCLFRPVTYL